MQCYTGLLMTVQAAAERGDQRAAGLLAAYDQSRGDQHAAVLATMEREFMPGLRSGDREPGDDR